MGKPHGVTVERFTLPPGPDAGALARQRARQAADRRLPREAADTLHLLVDELVSNAAATSDAADPLEIVLEFREESVAVEVVAAGEAYGLPADPESTRRGAGLGLHLVEGRADRWGVTCDGRTRVWFELSCAA